MKRNTNKVIRKKGNVDLNRVIRGLSDIKVSVGIHRGEVNEGVSLAAIGAVHEYGDRDGHTPERSFLRSTYRENIKIYKGDMQKIVKAVIAGKYTAKIGMGRLGRKVEQDVKSKITGFINPPLKPSTIARKGSSTPLIDHGFMINSIRWQYTENGGT